MIKKLALATIMSLAASASFAGGTTWNFGSSSVSSNSFGNTLSYSIGSGSTQQNLTVTGWSSTGTGCSTVAGNYGDDTDSCVETGKLIQNGSGSNYSGIGIQNNQEAYTSPNHAIDNTNYNSNSNGDLDFDMVLLTFDKAVSITGFNTGWEWGNTSVNNVTTDTDSSVYALDDSNEISSFASKNWSDILTNGWSIVNEIDGSEGLANGALETFQVSNGEIYSKYWLVGAYNSLFSNETWTDHNDAFKLHSLTTVMKPGGGGPGAPVNAPATIAIFAGLLGLMLYRRKN